MSDHFHSRYLAQIKGENRWLRSQLNGKPKGDVGSGIAFLALAVVFLAGMIYLSSFNIDFDTVCKEGSTCLIEGK